VQGIEGNPRLVLEKRDDPEIEEQTEGKERMQGGRSVKDIPQGVFNPQ